MLGVTEEAELTADPQACIKVATEGCCMDSMVVVIPTYCTDSFFTEASPHFCYAEHVCVGLLAKVHKLAIDSCYY